MRYAYWLLVGALVGLGVAALLTIGLAFLLVAVVLTVIGLRTPALRDRSMLAIPAGIGLAVFYLAWLNRDGPGRVCSSSGTSISCVEQWSPWPFIIVAALLVLTPVVVARFRR